MKQVDYIIVGLGIGGLCLSRRLLMRGRSVQVFDAGLPKATLVAAGVVNPVVLKRINPVWKAAEFMKEASAFYHLTGTVMDRPFIEKVSLMRVFSGPAEHNQWSAACDRPELEPFLNPEIVRNDNTAIRAQWGFGRVEEAFRLDTEALLAGFERYLEEQGVLHRQRFDYKELTLESDAVRYGTIRARKIVFCEGTGLLKNPFYDKTCLIPKKGEYITFKAPDLKLKSILKGPYFIIPLGSNNYQAGATFAHGDLSPDVTETGQNQLRKAVEKMIQCPVELTGQTAGMRPTVADRRPLLGRLGNDPRLYVLNGFGTRGLLMAPLLSQWLVDHMEQGVALPEEADIKRF